MMIELTQLPGVFVAEVTGVDGDGRPLVGWNGLAPIAAQAVWTRGAPPWRDCIGAQVLVGLLYGDETRLIVLGLLEPPPALDNSDPVAETTPETLRVEAGREIVIECGEAKISLRKDGRIEIR